MGDGVMAPRGMALRGTVRWGTVMLAVILLAGCGDDGDVRSGGESPPVSEGATDLAHGEGDGVRGEGEPLVPGAQARSFLGEALFPPPLDPEFREEQTLELEAARTTLEADPDDPEPWIWVGRRQAYLGEYREAIETFTQGLERFPEDARFLRHRGHRYLTVREPAWAEADLAEGLRLVEGQPDEIEPDGLPNPQGIPLSTLHFNLWYHLGLARYLQDDWQGAVEAFRGCMEVSDNPDLQVATSYWLYLALNRAGRSDEGAALLADLPADEDVIENASYLYLLRLFAGEVDGASLRDQEGAGTLGGVTVRYGIAAFHQMQGREDQARAVMHEVLSEPRHWPAFGYLATEAEVARRGW